MISRAAVATAFLMIALGLCQGCASDSIANAIAQAKNDNATICAHVSGYGVDATFIRLNPLSSQDAIVKCPTEIQQGNTTPPPSVNVAPGATVIMNQSVNQKNPS